MRQCNQERFRQQVQFLRRQFLQGGDLPFTDVLTEEAIAQALATLTGWLEDNVPAPGKPAPTVRPVSACRRSSSARWLVPSVALWTPGPSSAGCGKVAASTCSTGPRLPCRTRQKTKRPIRKSTIRRRALVSRSHASGRLRRCGVGRSSIWDSAATPAKDKAKSVCSVDFGTYYFLEMFSWPIA